MKQLNEFDTLEGEGGAREEEFNQERFLTPAKVFQLLASTGSTVILQEAAKTDDVAASFLLALNSGSVQEFDVRNGSEDGQENQASLTYLVGIGAITESFRNAVIDKANNNLIKPYKGVTLLQFNQAKKIYTEIEVVDYVRGKDLKITLTDELPENCALTTWEKDGDFDYQNFGKTCHLSTNQTVYKLKLDNKAVDGKLYVRIPFENFNYTVEMI